MLDGTVVSVAPALRGAVLNYRLRKTGSRWRVDAVDLIDKGHT
jgi:hypothetical protein